MTAEPDDYDPLDDDAYDVDDEDNEAEMNCGQHYDEAGKLAGCSLVGTEWCDWSCPFSDEMMKRPRMRRRDPKQGEIDV